MSQSDSNQLEADKSEVRGTDVCFKAELNVKYSCIWNSPEGVALVERRSLGQRRRETTEDEQRYQNEFLSGGWRLMKQIKANLQKKKESNR